ncbi:uncharacterized protein LOC123472386 [Daphnia magna]|uniref:uncharacterized protein LOC123472386 n=1 Tax=Daphnia magna TaxID=35525 RepID=UPI001E1BDEAD|nr:uncharacterized protein LOC123472386 [Daphnia magna]
MATNFGKQAGPLDEICQTSDNSEFPPLSSAKQLKRERAVEKGRHTKLITKIDQHIANFGSKRELAVHRASLADQLEECIAAHGRYVEATDFNEEEDANPDEWIRKCEAITMEVYGRIDKYIRTPRSSIHSSVVNEEALNNTLRNQPDNNDSIVSSSVSRRRNQDPDPAAIMNEIQQRLRQEIELRRNVEEQLSKATTTMTQMTIDSAKLSSEIERNAEFQRKIQQQAEQMAKDKKNTEEAELQYRALVEKEKRQMNERYEKAMEAVENRIKQLEELSRQEKEAECPEKADASAHGAIQKKRVDFNYRNTEVTVEAPNIRRETNQGPSFFRPDAPSFEIPNQGPSFFRPDASSFGVPNQGPSVFRSAAPSFGAQSQGASYYCATAPPSDGANQRSSEKNENRKSPTVDSSKWSFNQTKYGPANSNTPNRKSVFRMPRLDLDPFDGDPRKWPTFIANFKDLVNDDQAISSTQKMALLRSCLKPNIQQSLGDCLNDPALYEAALEELECTYGHPHLISRAYIRTILDLPKVPHFNDYRALLGFSTSLRGAVSSLKNGGYENELNSGGLLEIILDKLPADIQSKWGKKIVKSHPQLLTLQDFVPWLHTIVKAEMVVKHAKASNSQPTEGKTGRQDRKPGRQIHSKFSSPVSPTILSISTASNSNSKTKIHSTVQFKNLKECLVCNGNHKLQDCKKFSDFSQQQKCGVDECQHNHHRLLHGAPRIFPKPLVNPTNESPAIVSTKRNDNGTGGSTGSTHCYTCAIRERDRSWSVLLAVVPITIWNGKKHLNTFGLLDPGSEASLILDHAADKIGLTGQAQTIRLRTFHGQDPDIPTRTVNFDISPRDDQSRFKTMNALTVPQLNFAKKKCHWPSVKKEWNHLADLDLPTFDSALVTVIIGRDIRGAHRILEERCHSGDTGPDAILTPFGWCVAGSVPSRVFEASERRPGIYQIHFQPSDLELREDIARLWQTEAFGVQKPTQPILSTENRKAMDLLEKSIRHTGERQEVALMWKEENAVLPNNYSSALQQLQHLSKRFKRDPAYGEKYNKVIQEYLSLGHAIPVDPSDTGTPGRVFYLPHHGVTSVNKPDKVRVVFNCSAQHNGISLNDMLHQGPDLLTSQVAVLLRFRQFPVPIAGDIEKMYHQVQVPASDQSALRFLYQAPGINEPIKAFQMTRHVFGAVSSPTTCIFALRKTAEDNRHLYPTVAELVLSNTYVDNLLYSAENEDDAIRDAKDFKALCLAGGFNVVQWMSSSRRVLSTVAPSELSRPHLDFNSELLPVERTLGILLDWETDQFMYKVELKPASTMREVLQGLSKVHDPLGLIAPAILPARILMQDIWHSRCGWDDVLDQDLQNIWTNWTNELKLLEALRIPRCIRRVTKPDHLELHAFSDASENGFGACVYLRCSYPNEKISVALVIGKARVAPLKQLSIPRLELQGAVLAARLVSTVRQEMNLKDVPKTYWTDSQTVLQWIHSTSCRYHAFVAHRITEIVDQSVAKEWRHIPGELNPADDASRGIPASSLNPKHRWFCGPSFLLMSRESWPAPEQISEPSSDDPEVAPSRWVGSISNEPIHPFIRIAERVSTLEKFKSSVGWLRRFARNYSLKEKPKTTLRFLSVPELRRAMTFAFRIDQQHYFARELEFLRKRRPLPVDSKLVHHTPFLDVNSVMRVGGRLDRSAFNEDIKHPIILHHESQLARLVIQERHIYLEHSRPDRTLHDVRSRYYIPKLRRIIKSVVGDCAKCRLLRSKPAPPIMAPLPSYRLRPFTRPFSGTGIDYFGPMPITMLRRSLKRWGVMFTCLTTRAVHIELAETLSTDSFLLAFWRFVNVRGCPGVVYSDNGTNLVAGEKEISEGLARFNQERIGSKLAKRGIEWHFSPPIAPHFGGSWERLIQSAKSALRIILDGRTSSNEILQSALVGAATLMNGRPLEYVPVDPKDPIPLTPNHFLLLEANPNEPLDVLDLSERPSTKGWRAAQDLITHFWRRWLREIVPKLNSRSKWTAPNRNIAVNDIVLIVDPATRRGEWPLGRVLEVFPDLNGTVRSASVAVWSGKGTETKLWTRAAHHLCVLETEKCDVSDIRNRAGCVTDENLTPQRPKGTEFPIPGQGGPDDGSVAKSTP